MKKIEAIIKPFKLDDVKERLNKVGVTGMTIGEVRGYGNQLGRTEVFRGAEYVVDFIPKLKIELVIDDSMLDEVIEAILDGAYTGKIGDGKIFIQNIEDVIRVRTKDRGASAL